ncbi:MAG: hypothetical protein LBC38_05115, partial [Oscillospiraceae bacterium]|nr:hypothetical protein [Oscillospiraceae bacterium]
MQKFIPYEKLSKKARREQDARRRGSWNGLNPVTRVPANPKAYNRSKLKQQTEKFPPAVSVFLLWSLLLLPIYLCRIFKAS